MQGYCELFAPSGILRKLRFWESYCMAIYFPNTAKDFVSDGKSFHGWIQMTAYPMVLME